MKTKSITVVILILIGTIAVSFVEVTTAAETTINMGSIRVHGPTNNPYVVCSPINYNIKVRPTGNTITIQVDYSLSCPGTADDGYCDISFVGGGGSDSRHTGGTDAGILTISKFMNPGDTFKVMLHAKYTDMYGGTTLGEDTEYANGTVTSVTAPVADFSFTPVTPTTDTTVQFIDMTTVTDTTIISWSWSFGDGSSSTEKTPTHRYLNSGKYTVTFQVTDDYGLTSLKTKEISVKRRPVAAFYYSPVAPTTDDIVHFTDSSYDYDGNVTAWSWNFGDGVTSNNQNPTHQFQNYGSYNVILEVTDSDGLIDINDITYITVKKKPTAHFSFSPSTPKLDDTIQFTDLSSAYNSTIISYSWNFGDGTTSTEKNPTHKYQSSRTYTVTLEVTDSNGLKRTKTASIPVNQNQAPVSSFTHTPSEPTTADSIQFTDSSYDLDGNIVSWSWNFGDGTSSTEKNPTHQYSTSGTYTVILQVLDNEGVSGTKTTEVAIKEKSIPGFELIILICAISLVIMFLRKKRK